MDTPLTPTPIKPPNKTKNNKQQKKQRLQRKEQKELKTIPIPKEDNNQNNNNSSFSGFVEEEFQSVGKLWNMSKKERKKLEKKNIKVKPPEQQQYVTDDKDVNKSFPDKLASLDDDEELPSVEELLNRAITPKKECEKKNNVDEPLDQQQEQEQSEPELSNYDVLKDETLSIPGELVLAYSLRKYYPAKIIGYEKPGKYHILFCDGSKATLGRNKFYVICEKGFVTCNLGEIVMEKEDPDYKDPELIAAILDLESTLSNVLLGNDKLAWRYDHFVEGKKKRLLLATRVSQGPFNQSEFGLIAKVLRHMYVPDVAKAIDKKDNIVKPSELIMSIMKLENKQYREEEQQDNQQELSLSSQQLSTPVSTPHKHNNLTDVTSRKSLYSQSESSSSQQLTTSVSTPRKRKHLSSLSHDVTPHKHSRQQSETSSPSLAQPTTTTAAASSSSLSSQQQPSSSSPSSPSPSSPPPSSPSSPSPSLSSSSSSLLYDKLKRPFFNYSSDLQLRFVNDVLIPETIIRLIMKEDGLSYKEADYKMTDGYEDLRWVETIMSSRSCFSK